MALQGTLETFALPDVLRLLATTKNTGCLTLSSEAGTGSIHLDDGAIVAAGSSRVAEHRPVTDVVFDLLRFVEGSFAFEVDVEAPSSGAPIEVDDVLVEAESMLAEWREIEKVVPSLDHWVTLAQDLPGHEVIVSAARWRTIAAVGGGRTVRGIADSLDMGEVDVSRTVKDLVESGLAAMGEDVGARTVSDRLSMLAASEPASGNGSEPAAATPEPFDPEALTLESPADSEAQEPAGEMSADDAFMADVFPGLATKPGDADEGETGPDEVSDEDLSRQLANLSPKAAAAVQAAAHADSDEERDAALDEAIADDEDINRGLLLKFLGSVNN